MTLPNFLIIGSAKAGTTSLYVYLMQHPEIYMSPVKETHFFSFDNESKMTKGPGDPIYKAITDVNDYQALFNDVRDEKAIGEASTSYLYRPEAPGRILEMLPEVKLIAILRNPVDRAFSAYMHVVRDERETAENFEKALALEESRKAANWDPIWHFTSVGHYYEQLERYFKVFKRDQIKIYLYEDLNLNKDNLLKDIFNFLGVNPDFSPESSVRYNVTGKQKSQLFYKTTNWLFSTPNPVRWVSRQVFSDIHRGNFANWVRQRNLTKYSLSPETRIKLIKNYTTEILQLQDLLDRDLTMWLN